MTLRARLLLAAGLILVMVVGGAVVIIRSQESYLVGQIDDQLQAARPLFRLPPAESGGEPPTVDTPVSSLYVGVIENGELSTVLQGQLLDDVPDLDADTVASHESGDDPFTVGGTEDTTRFRVLLVPDVRSDAIAVLALPLDEVDRAVDRLRTVLVVGGLAIAAVLALAVWWVERLGLRPVARVTTAAEEIAKGAQGVRVEGGQSRTEADRLAASFNVMVDEREAAEQRLRRFVSDASHELRTPLTSIRGYLDLYQDGGFRGEGDLDDVIRRMRTESSRMQELVEDLLLLAKLDEERSLASEPVDLGQLLDDAATDARILQPDRSITVDVVDPPVRTSGDAYRLQQVVGVLVTNALVHTDEAADLRLSARRSAVGPTIVVTDSGPGMDASEAEHVFERFYRGDRSRARSTGGSGLGLAIAKSIVEAHGGDIDLDTAPGQGCSFTVRLPDPDASLEQNYRGL